MGWHNVGELSSRSYVCGHCNNPVASNMGFFESTMGFKIYICHHCKKPSFFGSANQQIPGPSVGDSVASLPDDIMKLYDEARNCIKVNAYTASAMASRKLLMNIAVSKGAKPGNSFISYVEYLANNNYLPPGSNEWVDHIRNKGNDASHEIRIFDSDEADELIKFTSMLLKLIFEFPAIMKSKMKS